MSEIIAGTVLSPAIVDALYLLSPAIISYLSPNLLKTKGCIIPCCLIDSDNSFNPSSSNASRG